MLKVQKSLFQYKLFDYNTNIEGLKVKELLFGG